MNHEPMDVSGHLFPVLSPVLWEKICARFSGVSSPYMKRLGILAPDQQTPTIEHYFQVKTFAPRVISDGNDVPLVEFVPRSALMRECEYSPIEEESCPRCGTAMQQDISNAQTYCTCCGESRSSLFLVSGPGGSHGMGPSLAGGNGRRLTAYIYKRQNHFLDHLKRVQAKESTSIKPEILEAVESELKKERIDLGDRRITTSKVRSILKKLKLQRYYNHVFTITSRLSGMSPPSLTILQEEKLLSMFQMIQGPFERHCPPERTNMLSYSYVLRKLVEILGWTDLVGYFPLLKSRQKVYLQDKIWKHICDEVGFKFYRSIA